MGTAHRHQFSLPQIGQFPAQGESGERDWPHSNRRESAEPSFDELPKEDFLALFPAGTYFFFAKLVEGGWMVGTTELTQTPPEQAELLNPEEDAEVDAGEDLDLEWNDVADPDPPHSVVEFYEVVAEKDEDEEIRRVFNATMLPGQTSLRVPREFLEAGKDYKAEIIVQETSGNRTSIEVPFSTTDEEDGGDD